MSWFRPKPLLLPTMLANNGRNLAHKPAVEFGEDSLTWAEFVGQCARFAAALSATGIKPGQRVGVVMNNSMETVITLFGCAYGGYVSVPINVSVADSAIKTMLHDSAVRVVVCNAEHVARVDVLRAELDVQEYWSVEPVAGWQTFADCLARAKPLAAPAEVAATDECNIIYSSGTTGLPKGIVHDHRCRAAWAYDMAIALRYHAGAKTLCSLGLYSNISWVAMLSTILAGGTLVIMPAFKTKACIKLIEDAQITHTTMVPVQLQRLLADADYDSVKVQSLYSLMCCGSPLDPTTKQAVVDAFGGAFMELYGLTEGVVTVLQPEDMSTKLMSVGRPCPGQQLKILDDQDKPCAPGVSGEIVGRGPLQMAGYHQNEQANRESTWTDHDGLHWLRTGDIGRIDEDGYLYLVDRKKDMIISGGQNIYPADIEAVIAGHSAVIEVAVIGVASDRWGETPLAVVVGDIADREALVAWVNERVGKQQRIAAVELVESLPRNPNGKVLKRELREHFSNLKF